MYPGKSCGKTFSKINFPILNFKEISQSETVLIKTSFSSFRIISETGEGIFDESKSLVAPIIHEN